MTETTILDERAVEEIEARADKATPPPWECGPTYRFIGAKNAAQYPLGGSAICNPNDSGGTRLYTTNRKNNGEFIAHAREDIPALCATVKHLRAQIDAATKVIEPSLPESGIEDACRQLKQAYITERDNCETLESQLEQLRVELAEEKRLRAELKQIAQIGISEVSSVGTALKDIALIDFRSRAIQLCKDKAAEWEKKAKRLAIGDEVYSTPAIKARAAIELATALEKL